MIGWLAGTVREIDPAGYLLLDVNGVGYDVHVSMQTLCQQKNGQKAELYIHTHVREDQITLFGFGSVRERELFRKLNTVSGIGARTAIALLSGMSVDELLAAIDSGNDTAIARTPGIGKKTAQRLILELKGKLVAGESGSASGGMLADLRSALENLGYKPAQIDAALKTLEVSDDFEKMFRMALKALG